MDWSATQLPYPSWPLGVIELHRMHETRTVAINVRGVCPCQSVRHAGSFGAAFAKLLRPRYSVRGLILIYRPTEGIQKAEPTIGGWLYDDDYYIAYIYCKGQQRTQHAQCMSHFDNALTSYVACFVS